MIGTGYSYKGMAQTSAGSTTRNITPQATGFSQVHSRSGGEGGGQAMSVLLSWHEKVQPHVSLAARNVTVAILLVRALRSGAPFFRRLALVH
jgi:hypothetical protein